MDFIFKGQTAYSTKSPKNPRYVGWPHTTIQWKLPNAETATEKATAPTVPAGTANRVAKFVADGSSLIDSTITEVGSNVGIGTTSPLSGFDYRGNTAAFYTRDIGPNNALTAQSALQLGLSNAGSRFAGVGPSMLFFGENSAGNKAFLGRVSAVWENPMAGAEAGALFFQTRANSGDANALTERMHITAGGNVGIGTSTPFGRLHVHHSGSFAPISLSTGSGSEGAASFRLQADSGLFGQGRSFVIYDDVAAQYRLVINGSGNVGLGTTTLAAKLQVVTGNIAGVHATSQANAIAGSGVATIQVPEDFRLVTDEKGITVQVTPMGAPATIWCVKKSLDKIELKGSADVEFDYLVNGVRRLSKDHQPIVENTVFVPRSAEDNPFNNLKPAALRRLKDTGILNEDGSVNLETVKKLDAYGRL